MSWSRLPPAVVLVQTFHPGNLGSVARAMRCMGLDDLRLVQPKTKITQESRSLAAGGWPILEKAQYFDDLATAVADCPVRIATSASERKPERPPLTPKQASTLIWQQPQASALIFGGERDGLSLQQIRQCSHLCQIPANDDYGVLNLSHAVQILAWEWRQGLHAGAEQQAAKPLAPPLADPQELQALMLHWQQQLMANGYFQGLAHEQVRLARLHGLLAQKQFSVEELALLNGMVRGLSR